MAAECALLLRFLSWCVAEELNGALHLEHIWVCNVWYIYAQNDCIHKMAAMEKAKGLYFS